MILARIVFYVTLLAVAVLLGEFWWSSGGRYPFQWSIGLYQVILLFVVTIEVALLAARVFHDEIRGQTLATLMMLPESTTSMVYSKLTGALITATPGICCLAAPALTDGGWQNIKDFLDQPAGYFFLSNFMLVPHIAATLSLYMRWGCVPLAIGLGVGSLFGWISLFQAFRVGPGDAIVSVATVIASIICVTCHWWVVFRLPAIAARC